MICTMEERRGNITSSGNSISASRACVETRKQFVPTGAKGMKEEQ